MKDANGLSAAGSKAGTIERALLDLLAQHEADGMLPTSGRFLFYELVQAGIVPKAATGKRRADQDTSEALLRLREAGLVPWDWIEDETRELIAWRSAASVAEYVAAEVARASLDPWLGGDEPAPLILCESRSLAGALRATAMRYGAPIAATNGQAKGFLVTKVAPRLRARQRVLYVGDWDWCGHQIEDHSKRTLREHSGLHLDGETAGARLAQRVQVQQFDARWERVALTEAQVRDNDLPVIQKADNRYRPARYFDAVETEALGQANIVAAVAARLDELMPEPIADVLARQQQQREQVTEALRGLL